MAKAAGPTADILLKRVRAYGGIAYPLSDIYTLLSRVQRLVNAGLKRVVATTTLTTLGEKLIYTVRNELPDAIDILEVVQGTRRIPPTPDWRDLKQYDVSWFRSVAGLRYETWSQVGRDLLILYPGMASNSSVDVYYTKYTSELTDSTSTFELPDEDISLVLDVAEVILLVDLRNFEEARRKIEELSQHYATHLGVKT